MAKGNEGEERVNSLVLAGEDLEIYGYNGFHLRRMTVNMELEKGDFSGCLG